jgi:hypothetical protein
MTATLQLSGNWLDRLQAGALAPYAGIYQGYLGERGCAPSTEIGYLPALFTWAGR